jgi:TetR/AcrR family transcriptional regulator, regulator of autoinduction and epiphytic fitness
MPPDEARTTDRRVLRGQRNREAVVQAMIDLVEEGELTPTAAQVADRAGVALRSIYHYFDDLQGLQEEVLTRYYTSVLDVLTPLPVEGPLDRRTTEFAEHRAVLAERVMPVFRASLLTAAKNPGVTEQLAFSRAFLRAEVQQSFDTELQDAAPWKLEAIDAISSLDGWGRLRITQHLEIGEAQAVLVATIRAVLRAR